MKCWVCSRQANGYGHVDKRYGFGNPQRYPMDWQFCSLRCQQAFQKRYDNWIEVRERNYPPEATMIDVTSLEIAAMRHCLKSFGEAANLIGFDKPLGAYSEAQALSVINAIVTTYVEAMAIQHERSKYPPIRMPQAKAVSDPMQIESNPFADLKDDLPWETTK